MARGIPSSGINAGWFRVGDPALKIKSEKHRKAIGEAQRRAWTEKRQRLPLGTTRVNAQGYVVVKVVEGSGAWKLQHVIEMEAALDRPLSPAEVVHHINGDRKDNRLQNLFLCRDRSHHNKVHNSQDSALRACLEAGVVVFKDGKYETVLP